MAIYSLPLDMEKSSEAPDIEHLDTNPNSAGLTDSMEELKDFVLGIIKWKGRCDTEYFKKYWGIDEEKLSRAVEELQEDGAPLVVLEEPLY